MFGTYRKGSGCIPRLTCPEKVLYKWTYPGLVLRFMCADVTVLWFTIGL